ncbi:MAG: Xaa-Pro peptidase family protein [Nanoarchaeota archaeon]
MLKRRITNLMDKKGLDALVLFGHDANFAYLTGRNMESSVLVFPKNGRPVIIANPLEFTKGLPFCVRKKRDVLGDVQEVLKQRKTRMIGINESGTSLVQYRALRSFRPKDVGQDMQLLRAIKTGDEMVKIRKACRMTTDIFLLLIQGLKKGRFRTEGDISLFLKQKTLLAGCELAFIPVVASGADSENPHYQGNKRLRRGFLVVDFGVKWNGYCSDVTRTFFLGNPTNAEQSQYETVRSALEGAIAFVRMGFSEGLEGCEVDAYTREALGPDAKHFIHALGHGIGREVHEYPSLSKRKGHNLLKGMALAIEPAIYKKMGVRIEDDVYLGKDVEVLTKGLTRNLLCF